MSYGTGSLILITRGDKLPNRGINSQWSNPFWLKAQICPPFQGTDYPCDRGTIPDIVIRSWDRQRTRVIVMDSHAPHMHKNSHSTNTETTANTTLHFFLSYFKQSCSLVLHGAFSVFCLRVSFFFFLPNFRRYSTNRAFVYNGWRHQSPGMFFSSSYVCVPGHVYVLSVCYFLCWCFHCLHWPHIDFFMFGFQSVEDCETVPDGGPVYSYTRQQLTGKTIHQNNPGLYERMEELQTKLSLVVAGLDPTTENERYLTPKDTKCFDISVLAVIPSNTLIPKWVLWEQMFPTTSILQTFLYWHCNILTR